MRKILLPILVVSILGMLSPGTVQAIKKKADKTSLGESSATETPKYPTAADLQGLALRNIGPALMSGRIADVAIDPTDRSIWYAAAASGGVWKTVNAGTTWTPIFDDYGSYSIGCVTIDPANPHVIWIGTGENNSQRSAGYGDGVYKSLDGGKSFERVGLETSEHIGKIVIDPRDSDTVWVAAQGPLWKAGGERGLYKTVDGGKTWTRSLFVSDNTGISDVMIDPRDPDTVYAASYQRRRRQWTLVAGGPEGAIYKSVDGGETWRKLENGLPTGGSTGGVGRIGLAISPQNPDVLYATIAASDEAGGFFRSSDRGESWSRQSDYTPVDPQYYMEIFADPHQFDRIYSMDTFMQVTSDGGKTWTSVPSENKHVDSHALAFLADDPDYLLNGNDGGLYESWDRGETWKYIANLPVTQFYRVGIDNDEPFYNVYGGTQDNNTQGGPSRTNTVHGITNREWFNTVGGDGYQTRVDPTNPDILYSLWQYGGLVRYDRASGELVDIQPQPAADEPPLKWNWDSPLLLSHHSPTRLYFAANRLFVSDDRGNSWRAVSDDLTRGIDRNQLEVMGRVWSPDAVWKNVFTSFYGSAVALDESPLVAGLLYVGTDDGLLWVSENAGETWRKIESFPGVPENTLVSDITASGADSNVVYATFNNHKSGDFTPYVLKSSDRGATWTSIASDLPERHVAWSIVEDFETPNLLFLGTEFGLFTSLDGGGRWIQLKGGLPIVAVRDLEIQRRENDLVVGTFGRGIAILDDYTPLRQLSRELSSGSADATVEPPNRLFEIKDPKLFIEARTLGYDQKAEQGDAFFTAPNPPSGAIFTYSLAEGLETRRAVRRKTEREAAVEGESVEYPSWEALRAEDREHEPAIVLTVRDSERTVVRRLLGPTAKGIHRIAWDLRHPTSWPRSRGAKPRRAGDSTGTGPLVVPGTYTVELASWADDRFTSIGEPQSFEATPLGLATLAAEDRAALAADQARAGRLQGAVEAAIQVVDETRDSLVQIQVALLDTPAAEPALAERTRALELALADLDVLLRGDRTIQDRREPRSPSIRERISRTVNAHWQSTSGMTETHRRNYEIAAKAFAPVLERLRQLVETDLASLHEDLDAIDAPWTPGRGVPTWTPELP